MIDGPARIFRIAFTCVLIVLMEVGCSFRQYAVNNIGDMLAEGDSVYETEDDIILVGDALPFSLKFVEILLEESPDHPGLLLTAARGYTTYAYAYVHFEADMTAADDLGRARELRARARRLYTRGHNYAVRGLELQYPDIGRELYLDPDKAVLEIAGRRAGGMVPMIYWTAASLGLAISVSRDDATMLARLAEVEALIDRAMQLDESWNRGTLHEFQVILAGAQLRGVDETLVRDHYQRAFVLSGGRRAGLHLALAEAVSVPNQDKQEFMLLLDKALAIDPDSDPEGRFENMIAQRRAHWLKGRTEDLFLE